MARDGEEENQGCKAAEELTMRRFLLSVAAVAVSLALVGAVEAAPKGGQGGSMSGGFRMGGGSHDSFKMSGGGSHDSFKMSGGSHDSHMSQSFKMKSGSGF